MKRNDYLIIVLMSIYLAFLPLVPSTKYEWGLNILLLATFIIYLFELMILRDIRNEFKRNFRQIILEKFTIIFILFVTLMFLSSIYSIEKVEALKEASRYLIYIVTYFFIRLRFNKRIFYEIIIKVFLCSALIVNILGIYDFIKHYHSNENMMYILNHSRVQSTLGHPNSLGAYLILLIFPIMANAIKSRGKQRILYAVYALFTFANIILTWSRSAWLALLIGILLMTILYNKKLIFLIIIPSIITLLVPNVLTRILQFKDTSLNIGRFNLWSMALKIIKEHLIFGVGAGNFITQFKLYLVKYPQYRLTEAETLPPHNSYIRSFVELGILGGVIFILLCVIIVKDMYFIKEKSHGIIKNFYLGFLVSSVCFLIMNFFDDLFFIPKVTFNFIFFIALAYSVAYYDKIKISDQ